MSYVLDIQDNWDARRIRAALAYLEYLMDAIDTAATWTTNCRSV